MLKTVCSEMLPNESVVFVANFKMIETSKIQKDQNN